MYCLDTDAVVDFLRGNKNVSEKVEQNNGHLFVAEISILELYYGAYISANVRESIEHLKGFLKNIQVLKIDNKVIDLFGKTKAELKKKGEMLDNFDLVIACIALAYNKILVTNNVKHFERIKDLKIENWLK